MPALRSLRTTPAGCCLCGPAAADPVAAGADYEYRVSDDPWHVYRCRGCGLLFLNPRPADDELDTVYPPHYHAFAFTDEQFGFVTRVRRRLEARRLLGLLGDLPPDARVLDVGCGDGFHLKLLREFGPSSWTLEGVDPSGRAVERAKAAGLTVHRGTADTAPLPAASYDAVLLVMTVEHVADPPAVLARVREWLTPGGRLVVVTDNARSLDAGLFARRYWGGYHFPRHTYLFDRRTLAQLAEGAGLRVRTLRTIVSPVNWVYSVRNYLADRRWPDVLVRQFSLRTSVTLAAFTVLDLAFCLGRNGALLQGVFERPPSVPGEPRAGGRRVPPTREGHPLAHARGSPRAW